MAHFKGEADRYELIFTDRPRVSGSLHLIITDKQEDDSVSLPFSSACEAAEFAAAVDSIIERCQEGAPTDGILKADPLR